MFSFPIRRISLRKTSIKLWEFYSKYSNTSISVGGPTALNTLLRGIATRITYDISGSLRVLGRDQIVFNLVK